MLNRRHILSGLAAACAAAMTGRVPGSMAADVEGPGFAVTIDDFRFDD